MANYKFKQLPIYRDIKKVLDSEYDEVLNNYTATISTEKEDIPSIRVLTMDIIRDYVSDISEHGFIELQLPSSFYTYKVYPFRDNLEITITKKPLAPTDGTTMPSSSSIVYRYKAIPLDTHQSSLNNIAVGKDDDLAASKDVENYKFQLVDRRIEPLRIKTVSGVYRTVTVDRLISSLIATEASNIRVDGKALLDSIDMVKPDNTKTYTNIIIPSGTLLVDLPDIMQKEIAGVYSTGFGTYLQWYKDKYTWFIYPLYNTDRTKDTEEIAIIYSVPESTLPELDNTYTYKNKILTIIANQEDNYIDGGEVDMMQKGSGFRAADANSFMKKPIIINDNGVIEADRSRLNYEIATKERSDGLNYAPRSQITANPYTNYSDVKAREMARMDLVWQNGNPDLIYPGMPCKYFRTIGDKVIELKGTIVFMQAFTASQSNISANVSFRTTMQLTLLIDPVKDSEI